MLYNEELFINQDVWWEMCKGSHDPEVAGSHALHYQWKILFYKQEYNFKDLSFFFFTFLFPSATFLTYFLDKTFSIRNLFFYL